MANNPYTTDNPYAVQAPVVAPTYESTGPKTVSGYGTGKQQAGEGIAFLADKFLAGISQGRAQQFAKSQQAQGQLMAEVDRARQRVKESDSPEELKRIAYGKLDSLKVMQVKQEVDQGDKGHPATKAMKSAFEAILGPGKQKYEFGPEQIYKTISDVYSVVNDPKNTRAGALEKTAQSANQAIQSDIQAKQKENPNYVPTLADLGKNEKFSQAYNKAITLGGDPSKWPIMEAAKAETAKQAKIEESKAAYDAKPKPSHVLQRESNEKAYRQAHPELAPNVELTETQVAEGKAILNAIANPGAKGVVYGKVGDSDKYQQLFFDKKNPSGYTTADGKKVSSAEVKDIGGAPTRERLYGRMQLFYHIGKSKGMTDDAALNFAGGMAAQFENVELSGIQQRQMIAEAKNFIGSGSGYNWSAIEKENPGASRAEFDKGVSLTPEETKAAEKAADEFLKQGENKAAPTLEYVKKNDETKPLGPPPERPKDSTKPVVSTKPATKPATAAAPAAQTATVDTPQGPWPANPQTKKPIDGWKDPAGKFHPETPEDRRDYNAVMASSGAKDIGVKLPAKLQAAAQEKVLQRFGVTQEDIGQRVNFRNAAKKDYDANKALVDSTETFDKRLARSMGVLKSIDNLSPTDYRKVNEWAQNGYKELNLVDNASPFAQYVLAIQAVRSEYSRIIAGATQSRGQTSVTAGEHADALLQEGFSKKTMDGALSRIKQEIEQNVAGIRENLGSLQAQSKADLLPERHGGKWQGEPDPAPPPGTKEAPKAYVSPGGRGAPAPVFNNTSNGRGGQPPAAQNLKERTDIPKDVTASIAEGQTGTVTGPGGIKFTVKKQGGKVYEVTK